MLTHFQNQSFTVLLWKQPQPGATVATLLIEEMDHQSAVWAREQSRLGKNQLREQVIQIEVIKQIKSKSY